MYRSTAVSIGALFEIISEVLTLMSFEIAVQSFLLIVAVVGVERSSCQSAMILNLRFECVVAPLSATLNVL